MTVISENRKARFEYEILETFECGIALTGSEVKSLRTGKANIADAFADFKHGELYLLQSSIQEYKGANRFNHDPMRPRKLLLHRSEIKKLFGKVKEKGLTLAPLRLYFNDKQRVKLLLALAKGRKLHDKREAIKEREWNRSKARTLKGGGE